MKKNLTPEQLEKRAKTNKKILKFGCLPVLILCTFLIIILSMTDDTKISTTSTKINMDSIVSLVQKSKDFEIKEVYYNIKDSSFNIAITNNDNVIKKHDYSITYFDNLFHLDKIEEIEGIYLYEFKKGKSFKNGDYKEPLIFESSNYAKIETQFDNEYYSAYLKGYKPLNDYLKKTLNDPSSLEFESSKKVAYNNKVFKIESTFRAKNGFGALVLNNVTCDIDTKGNISNVQVTQ
ncbi:MAG: hypothetical protein H7239_03395 [Flavobacterium sp.]|nr:hypothetical protein [Flavobacterium sp.]